MTLLGVVTSLCVKSMLKTLVTGSYLEVPVVARGFPESSVPLYVGAAKQQPEILCVDKEWALKL
jgi:hypothetical protein